MLPPSAALRAFGSRVVLLALCLLALVASSAPSPASAEAGTGDTEAVIARRLGEARAAAGVAPVSRSSDLDAVAREWARRQAADGQMKHNPNLRDQVQPARAWYENVGSLSGVPSALSYGDAGHRLHRMWMDSAGHRANILRTPLTDVGIGVASSGDRIFATVVFRDRGDGGGGSGGGSAQPAPEPKPEPKPTSEPKPKPTSATTAPSGAAVTTSSAAARPPADPAPADPAPAEAEPAEVSPPEPDREPEVTAEPERAVVDPGEEAEELDRRTGSEATVGELAALALPADAPGGDRSDDRPPVELQMVPDPAVDLAVGDQGPRTVPLAIGLTTIVGAVVVGATRGTRRVRRSR